MPINNLKIEMKVYKRKTKEISYPAIVLDLGHRKSLAELSENELAVIDEYLEKVRKILLDSNKQK